jgi:asparagine synthase (glutamine-hydrolysing)
MCGVTGCIDWSTEVIEPAVIGAMTESLQLRGPDDAGIWYAPHVALGHTRLAIIDLATGSQPMVFRGKHGKPVALDLPHQLRHRGALARL